VTKPPIATISAVVCSGLNRGESAYGRAPAWDWMTCFGTFSAMIPAKL
jgi:hypothetical protein